MFQPGLCEGHVSAEVRFCLLYHIFVVYKTNILHPAILESACPQQRRPDSRTLVHQWQGAVGCSSGGARRTSPDMSLSVHWGHQILFSPRLCCSSENRLLQPDPGSAVTSHCNTLHHLETSRASISAVFSSN